MKKYLWSTLAIMLFILLSFGLVEALDIPFLTDPSYILEKGGVAAAGFSILFLALDIFIPVPASILMIANGSIFGMVVGALVSLTGALLATLLGYWVGVYGGKWLTKLVSEEEQAQAHNAMHRWGLFAVILSRPIPILSESILIMAAAMGLPLKKLLPASVLGLLPAIIIYAITGAYAVSVASNLVAFALVIGLALLVWVVGLAIKKQNTIA